VVDVLGVPNGLEQLVGKAQSEEVLHRLFAEVVVDAEHRVRREDLAHHGVKFIRGLEVVPKGLLDDDAAPRALFGVGEAGIAELPHHLRERRGRNRQVERVIAVGAALLVEFFDRLTQPREGVRVVERALHKPDALGKLLPRLLPERSARVLLDRIVDHLGEVLLVPIPPRKTGERERGRQQAPVGKVVHRGHELLAGEVARDAEHHEAARACDARQATIARVPQAVRHASALQHREHVRDL